MIPPEQSFATGYMVQVVDILCDEALQAPKAVGAARCLQPSQREVRHVRLRFPEVVVEDFPDHGPRRVGVGEEVVQLQHAGVVLAPQPAGAPEGRDAALNGDPRAGKGGEVARSGSGRQLRGWSKGQSGTSSVSPTLGAVRVMCQSREGSGLNTSPGA